MTPCTGILGRLFGHKYDDQTHKYSDEAMRRVVRVCFLEGWNGHMHGHGPSEAVSQLWRFFQCHPNICTRCGHVVNKEQK